MPAIFRDSFFRVTTILSFCLCAIPGVTWAQGPGDSEKAAYAQAAPSQEGWKVIATSPGVQVVQEEFSNPGKVLNSGESPLDTAQNWLAEKNINEGHNIVKGKLVYVSIGSATVNATPQDSGYIDSRYLAFQRAELEAKAKIAIYLGVDLTTERGSSDREINPQVRSELERIVNASPTLKKNAVMMEVKDTIYGLFQKAKILANAKLDEKIRKTQIDVIDQQIEAEQKISGRKARRAKIGKLRNINEASLKAAASSFAHVQGAQTIQTFEGSYKNGYQIVVITLWSQNMQQLVYSMQSGTAPPALSSSKAKAAIAKQLPSNPNELACLTGVRAYIDDKGEHVLLAFGQAGVETVSGRLDKAYERAGKKARLRAMAAMRTFMGERVAFAATEDLMEALAEYAQGDTGEGGTAEYKSISQFSEKIQASARKQKIVGLSNLMTKELDHPFTDKPMVLKVMTWSPSSQAVSQQVQEAIKRKPSRKKTPQPSVQQQPKESSARKGTISSGKGADQDAW